MSTPSPTLDPQLDAQHVWLLNEAWRPWLRREAATPPPILSAKLNGCVFIFMAVFALAGLLGIGFSVNEWMIRQRLQTSGIAVQGKITELNIVSDEGDRIYYATFSYQVLASEQVLSRRENVGATFYRTLSEGQAININYLPDDPKTARIVRTPPMTSAVELLLPALVGGGFIVIALITLFSLTNAQARARVLQTATVLPATLTSVSSRIDNEDDIILTYSFRLPRPNGTTFDPLPLTIVANQLRGQPLPPIGTPLAVLYASDANYWVL